VQAADRRWERKPRKSPLYHPKKRFYLESGPGWTKLQLQGRGPVQSQSDSEANDDILASLQPFSQVPEETVKTEDQGGSLFEGFVEFQDQGRSFIGIPGKNLGLVRNRPAGGEGPETEGAGPEGAADGGGPEARQLAEGTDADLLEGLGKSWVFLQSSPREMVEGFEG
jgi:hypothetical protein